MNPLSVMGLVLLQIGIGFLFGFLAGRAGRKQERQRGYMEGYGNGSTAATNAAARQEEQRVSTIPAAVRRGESLIPPRPSPSRLVSPPPAARRDNQSYPQQPDFDAGIDLEPARGDEPSNLGLALGAMTLQSLSQPAQAEPQREPERDPYREPERCESPRYEAPAPSTYDSGSCASSSYSSSDSGGGCSSDGGGGCGGGD